MTSRDWMRILGVTVLAQVLTYTVILVVAVVVPVVIEIGIKLGSETRSSEDSLGRCARLTGI